MAEHIACRPLLVSWSSPSGRDREFEKTILFAVQDSCSRPAYPAKSSKSVFPDALFPKPAQAGFCFCNILSRSVFRIATRHNLGDVRLHAEPPFELFSRVTAIC